MSKVLRKDVLDTQQCCRVVFVKFLHDNSIVIKKIILSFQREIQGKVLGLRF
jgi:hypothetical protein